MLNHDGFGHTVARNMRNVPGHACQCGRRFFSRGAYIEHRKADGPCKFRYGHPLTFIKGFSALPQLRDEDLVGAAS